MNILWRETGYKQNLACLSLSCHVLFEWQDKWKFLKQTRGTSKMNKVSQSTMFLIFNLHDFIIMTYFYRYEGASLRIAKS